MISWRLQQLGKSFLSVYSRVSFELSSQFSNAPEGESPLIKTVNAMKDDFKDLLRGKSSTRDNLFPSHCDVLIIGGGIMGSSTAFWLKHRALEGLNVVVVEKDPTVMLSDNKLDKLEYHQSTTCLSVGGIRQQFSLKENIELSLKSSEFLRNIKHYLSIDGCDEPNINFCPSGYLFLASEKGVHILEENYHLQRSLGAKVEMLTEKDLKTRYPWLNTEGIVAASHGLENEGWFDPYSLLTAFKRKAAHLGAHFISGEVTSFIGEIEESNVYMEGGSAAQQVHTAVVKLPDGSERKIKYGILVIAAGGMSGHIAGLLGKGHDNLARQLPLPVEPRKRYVFTMHCPKGPGVLAPMVIDASGAYVRRDGLGGNYLCGISPTDEEEPSHDNLDVDYEFFEHKLWPLIAHRIPAFEEAKLKTAWAGFYDFNRFDENAFIGPHPGYMNVYLATGFSGHGIQQAPAVGKAIMELIIDGDYQTINLERLHYDRYIKGNKLYESNIV